MSFINGVLHGVLFCLWARSIVQLHRLQITGMWLVPFSSDFRPFFTASCILLISLCGAFTSIVKIWMVGEEKDLCLEFWKKSSVFVIVSFVIVNACVSLDSFGAKMSHSSQ